MCVRDMYSVMTLYSRQLNSIDSMRLNLFSYLFFLFCVGRKGHTKAVTTDLHWPMRLARWQLALPGMLPLTSFACCPGRSLPTQRPCHTESSLIGLSSKRSKCVFSYLYILDSSRWKNLISWRYEDILCLGNVGNILRHQLIGNFVFYWAIMNASLPPN